MYDLSGKTSVVTGAAMGMGRSLSMLLVKEGVKRLAICDVDYEMLKITRNKCMEQAQSSSKTCEITIHKVDVSNSNDIERFVKEVQKSTNTIDLLFNNAGIVISKAFDRMTAKEFDKVMAVNVSGVVNMTRLFWPLLMAAKPNPVAIVNTSSIAGFMPQAAGLSNAYATSKYAVRGFTEHLAMQCKIIAPHIRCVCVHPSAIKTEIARKNMNLNELDERFLARGSFTFSWEKDEIEKMTDKEKLQFMRDRVTSTFERWGHSSDEAARIIVDGVKCGSTRVMVGWDAAMIDAWIRIFPRIFMSDIGAAIVMISSVVGQHFYFPLAALSGLLLMFLRGVRSKF